jgi:hypothetical protein
VLRAAESEELLAFVSKVIGEAERPEVFEARGSGLAVHSSGEQVRGRVLVVNDRLVTAYPEAVGGHIWPVTLREVVPWANGVEGQVRGECHGAEVDFFDTGFYANRRRYRVGETYSFAMSAFAYTLSRAAEMEAESDLGAKVSFKGASAYMPAWLGNESADIDDYWFHSPLEGEISTAELAGKPLRAYPITIAIPGDFEMRLLLFAAPHVVSPGLEDLAAGEDLEGFLWLQGRLSDT